MQTWQFLVLQTGKTYEWKEGQWGCTIVLKEDGKFEEDSWAIDAGVSTFMGNYKIDTGKLILTYTQKVDHTGELMSISSTETYTITDDNQFTDSEGRVYKIK